MKNNKLSKEQRDAKRKLRRNFFREAVLRELKLEAKNQLTMNVRKAMALKKLSTDKS